MKKIIIIFIIGITTFLGITEDEKNKATIGVNFLFPEYFGEIIEIKAKLVKKPNTYYAENLVKLSFYLEVLEINGKKLEKSKVVEFKGKQKKRYTIGTVHKFIVYERLREVGRPKGKKLKVQIPLHHVN